MCLYYTSTVLSAELQPLEAGPLGLLQSHSNDATCGRCQLLLGRLQLCTHLEPQQRGKSGKKHWDDLMPKFGQDGRMWQTWTCPGHIGCMGPISSYFHAETIGPIGMSMVSLFSVPCDIGPSWTRQALASALSLPGIGAIPCYAFGSAWASHTRKAKRMSCCRWKRLKGHDRRCDRDCHDSWHGWDEVKRSLFHLGRQLTVVSSITYKKTNGDETWRYHWDHVGKTWKCNFNQLHMHDITWHYS